MSVFRVERTKDYTVMSNHHLRNKALSLKAKGMLSKNEPSKVIPKKETINRKYGLSLSCFLTIIAADIIHSSYANVK